MALTPGRVLAAGIVVCAGAVALLLPPAPREVVSRGGYLRAARDQAYREWGRTRRGIAVRVVRDSLRQLIAAEGDGAAPQILFLGRWADTERAWIGARVPEILGRSGSPHPVGVAFVRDSLFRGTPALYFGLPDTAGGACVAIYAEGRFAPGPWLRPPPHRRLAPAMLGPCAYYARFGPAGPAVAHWLRTGGTALAMTAPTYPPPLRPPTPRTSWISSLVSGEGGQWFADQRVEFPLALSACATGRLEACRQFVQARAPENRFLSTRGIQEELTWTLHPEAVFLSDLLEQFGPERFAGFWTGSGSLEGAFANAFGEDLRVWTARWTRTRFGQGPARTTLTMGALGASFGAIAGFLCLAVLIAYRRRAAP